MIHDDLHDTIIQLATPREISAIHIVRISGPKSLAFLKELSRKKRIKPGQVYVSFFYDGVTKIDRGIFFYFQKPASYTGEDMAEIQCHGSLLIVDEIMKAGVKYGLRPAKPGEYTLRAFYNQKISLEQAEAVDVLIKSQTDYFKNRALAVLENRMGSSLNKIYNHLTNIIAGLEASIEFPEDSVDTEYEDRSILYLRYREDLKFIDKEIRVLLKNFHNGKLLEEGISVVIAGRPNSGKSTLMNLLLSQERVIVSDTPGTTRDHIQEKIHINGIPFVLSDTAGIRETDSEIEKAGINKGLKLLKSAHIVLYIMTADQNHNDEISTFESLKNQIDKQQGPASDLPQYLIVINKTDLINADLRKKFHDALKKHNISVNAELSFEKSPDKASAYFEETLTSLVKNYIRFDLTENAVISKRQAINLNSMTEIIKRLNALMSENQPEEIISEELKILRENLGELNMSWETGDIYNAVFSKFCIGK